MSNSSSRKGVLTNLELIPGLAIIIRNATFKLRKKRVLILMVKADICVEMNVDGATNLKL